MLRENWDGLKWQTGRLHLYDGGINIGRLDFPVGNMACMFDIYFHICFSSKFELPPLQYQMTGLIWK